MRRGPGGRIVGSLRFDGGSLSLNLVATVGRRFGQPVERLTGIERLGEWLAGVGLAAGLPLEAPQLERVKALREDIDALFRCVLVEALPPAALIESLNQVASGAPPPRLRGTEQGVALDLAAPEANKIDAVLGSIAADAIRILTTEDRVWLRTCEASDCRMLYLAGPRRARRWCSSEHCGNRTRVANHRARAKSRDAAR
jgi:predicted RNA-binding Zn ribbon-like protein